MSARPPSSIYRRLWRRAGVALCLVSCALVAWVVSARPTIGVAGQYDYPYRPAPSWAAALWIALLALPLVAGVVVSLCRRELKRWHEWGLALLLTFGSLLLHLGAAYAPKRFPGAELAWPFLWLNTEGAYAGEVRAATPVAPFLRGYLEHLEPGEERGEAHRVHLDVHPPGLILGFVALERLHDTLPECASWIERTALRSLPSVAALNRGQAYAIRHPLAVSLTAAHVAIALASLTPLLCFAAVRPFWPAPIALATAALTALVPGASGFNPSADQAYPALTLLLCLLAARAVAARRWWWGGAFGFVFYGAAFIHVGYGLVAVILAVALALAWRSERPGDSLGDLARAYWPSALAAALGFFVPVAVMRLVFGYPTFPVIFKCLANNAYFYKTWGRTYWPWLGATPFEFGASLGFGLLGALLVGWVLDIVGVLRSRSLADRSALLLASVGVLLALYLGGACLGETARLWLFLTPLLTLGLVDWLRRRSPEPRRVLACLVGAQLVQTILFAVALDLGRTTTFMIRLLGG